MHVYGNILLTKTYHAHPGLCFGEVLTERSLRDKNFEMTYGQNRCCYDTDTPRERSRIKSLNEGEVRGELEELR